jgi:hypothetical protein
MERAEATKQSAPPAQATQKMTKAEGNRRFASSGETDFTSDMTVSIKLIRRSQLHHSSLQGLEILQFSSALRLGAWEPGRSRLLGEFDGTTFTA